MRALIRLTVTNMMKVTRDDIIMSTTHHITHQTALYPAPFYNVGNAFIELEKRNCLHDITKTNHAGDRCVCSQPACLSWLGFKCDLSLTNCKFRNTNLTMYV